MYGLDFCPTVFILLSIFVYNFYMSLPVYELERILDEAIIDGKPHYLVKWKDYSSVESTWEPIQNLIDALEIVHQWKLINSPHTFKRQSLNQSKLLGKTKKIQPKQHTKRENQLQIRLNEKKTKQAKRCKSSSPENSHSSQCDFEKQFETSEYSFGQRSVPTRKSRSKHLEKQPAKIENNYSPRNQKNSSKSVKNMDDSDLNGFKVVGRVTKQVIQTVLWCFDWQNEKICEVELKDGRKVNMKRDDVKKICPDKLLQYYEKLERLRL